jgi:PAS domain S-box-containing protein
LSAAIAALVLAGWALNIDALTRVLPGAIAMNPATAVAVLALALGLACRSRRCMPAVRGLAGLAIVVGSIKFTTFVLGMPRGIDQILFADQLGRVAGAPPNRMAPNTAFALALLGAGLMMSVSRRPRLVLVSQLSCVGAAAIATVAAVGYALDVVALYRLHNYIAMALPTTIVLILLSLAVISLNPTVGLGRIIADQGPAGLLARTALPFAVLVPLTVGVFDRLGQQAGLYGTEAAGALALMANVIVNFLLLGGCILALFASDEERKRRAAAIARSERQYREAERVGHVGYWTVDVATHAVQWSNGFRQICGLPADAEPSIAAIIGACHPDDAAAASAFITRWDCDNWQFKCRVRRPDGSVRHVRSHGVCVPSDDGTPATILGVFCDITELEVARQDAERAKETTASFLANMSHEIRTPMNGVMGFVELLLRGELTETQRRHLGLVQDSAHALLKLLNDILDISKIEAGRLDIATTPYNVRHGITQCVRLMTPLAEQKKLDLTLGFADDVPAILAIDGLRMRQILINLVGNAIKFTSVGAVSVQVSRSTSRGGRAVLQIAVSDTGVGIPKDRLASIFDSFVQAEASTTRQFGGSGLGLSISRSLAQMMGGAIRVDSVVGQGTCMTLVLPWAEIGSARASDDEARPGAESAMPSADTRGGSILVIEDVDLNRILFGEMLADLGHRFDFGVDGQQACTLARQLDHDPTRWDLILMDLQMPVMDGLAATRAIRARGGRAAAIPIIALTASAFEDEIRDCHAAGMNDHLAKPVSIDQLRTMIDRWRAGAPRAAPKVIAGRPRKGPRRGSLNDRFAAKRAETHIRLGQILAELSDGDPTLQSALADEARHLVHFLAGCAGMFGEPALGDVAAATEHRLRGVGSPPGPATIGNALQPLIAALGPPPDLADVPHRRRA